MIIVEGCDGTGKTTLAKKLAEVHNMTYQKDPIPKTGLKWYCDEVQKDLSDVVMDRFHFGEHVYPLVKLDGRFPLDMHEMYMIEMSLMAQGACIVMCASTEIQISKVFETRGEDFITKDQINDVRSLMLLCYHNSILLKKIVTFPSTHVDDILIAAMRLEAQKRKLISEYAVGFKNCDVMLVGERSNVANHNRAFINHKGSGPYLMKAMYANQGVRYYVTNAHKGISTAHDVKTFAEEYEEANPRKVIALGERAAEFLKGIAVEHTQTYHPQFWKRFQSNRFEEFKNAIR